MKHEARWEEKERDTRMNKRCSFRRAGPTFSWRTAAVTITLSASAISAHQTSMESFQKVNRGGHAVVTPLWALGP